MPRVDVIHDSPLPPARVFAFLAEHENLGPVLGATVRRVRDGATERNGVGSVREIRVGVLPPFEETVTAVVPDRSIDYRITKGSPLKGHAGHLDVAQRGAGSRVRWTIDFGAPVPGLAAVIGAVLTMRVRAGLKAVDAKA
ncbi:MAG: hypothetical protein JWN17_1798 [Frankiales bacterium]|nr:hypothetical protein [Frankiales bacterium]